MGVVVRGTPAPGQSRWRCEGRQWLAACVLSGAGCFPKDDLSTYSELWGIGAAGAPGSGGMTGDSGASAALDAGDEPAPTPREGDAGGGGDGAAGELPDAAVRLDAAVRGPLDAAADAAVADVDAGGDAADGGE